jgi:hypothetical protein
MQYGLNILLGVTQNLAIMGLPDGVLKYRLRQRSDNFAKIFLKFSDRIIGCYLTPVDEGTAQPNMDCIFAENKTPEIGNGGKK